MGTNRPEYQRKYLDDLYSRKPWYRKYVNAYNRCQNKKHYYGRAGIEFNITEEDVKN